MAVPNEGKPSTDPSDERKEWYSFALAQGVRALDAQRDELSGIRNRAVSFTALTITAAAFLVGTSLGHLDRNVWFYVLVLFGTVAFAGVAILLVLVVSPGVPFKFILEPDVLIDWTDGDNPAPSEGIAQRKLAKDTLPKMMDDNEQSLKHIRRHYRWLLAVGVTTIAIWIAVVWIFA